jgi:hypothetical protein
MGFRKSKNGETFGHVASSVERGRKKHLRFHRKCLILKMEPVVGIEPTTDGLQNRCSTTELNWLKWNKNNHLHAVFDLLRFPSRDVRAPKK